jgi:uncharacterized OB-fold protein
MGRAARLGDGWQQGFWEAAEHGEVAVQRCTEGHHQFPGGPACRVCGAELAWVAVSGAAVLWSWADFHQRYFDDVDPPYRVLLVELAEGPRMYLQPEPGADWSPAIGDRVHVAVGELDGRRIPLATPVDATEVEHK